MKYIIPTIIILLTLSCSLDRTNPLDPFVSGEGYPGDVHNVHVAIPVNNSVEIYWDQVLDADGYYVYRSQSYDGLYELIGINVPANGYVDVFQFNPDGWFWYKMSAYILIDGEKLEGYRSEPKTWN